MRLFWVALGALLALPAHAQFFQHFFQGGQMFQQYQEPEEQHVGDASWFRERVAAAQCNHYLCPDTLACVDGPENCPCPFAEQVHCMLGGARLCVQQKHCDEVRAWYEA
ncbi:Long chronological lifespan protein 2 [Malassezia nana]|uniref:Long chronological lifespan protein 2 n=1 Tax=Malassezia nana TaxID=180528 RepID=A0AAF0J6P0_9BASI|nr:Long chronological lifespan protein 2 [Malassezia nana]